MQSYPFYPDVYQIATVLAMEKQGPAALEEPAHPTTVEAADTSLIQIPTAYRR